MKELNQHIKEEVQVRIEQQQKTQHKLLGSFKPHKGLTCYELDMETGKIIPATFDTVTVQIHNNPAKAGVHKKLIAKPFHLYVTALNLENAKRKFMKIMLKR